MYLETSEGPESRQHIVLALHKPAPIGSLAFPVPELKGTSLKLSVLRNEVGYPPDPDDESQWETFFVARESTRPGWTVVPAPQETPTRALRITFVRGEESLLDILDATVSQNEKGKEKK